MWNFILALHSVSWRALPCPRTWLAKRHDLSCQPSLCWTAMESTAPRASTWRPRKQVGAEISVEGCGTQAGMPSWMPNKIPSRPVRLALLAKNRTGYQNLCRLMTRYKLREKEKGTGAATLEEVAERAKGLVCLTGG